MSLTGLLDSAGLKAGAKIDVPGISAALITADLLALVRHGSFEQPLVPIEPIELSVRVDDHPKRILRLSPFTVCNFRPRHSISIEGGGRAEVLALGVDRLWCNEVCANSGSEYAGLSDVAEFILHPELPPIVQSIRRQILRRNCPEEPFLKTYVGVLLSHLVWNNYNSAAFRSLGATIKKTQLHDILSQIDAAIDEPIRVSDLAQNCGLSSSQFSRAFKHRMGVTPRKYILNRRLLRAKELLEETEQALCEIALDAGFSSQAHLTSMFAREFGMPPGLYRRLISERLDPGEFGGH